MTGTEASTHAAPATMAALRRIGGVLLGGIVGALGWLVVLQEGPQRGWSDHDYNETMGQAFVDRADDVARAGLWATLVAGVALAGIYALVVEPLLGGRRPFVAGLTFAVAPLAAWGLVLTPFTTAYEDTAPGHPLVEIPGGILGLDAGASGLVLGVVGSLVFAAAVSRIYRLATSAEWWRSRPQSGEMARGVLDEIVGEGSLELPEKRSKERRKSTRA